MIVVATEPRSLPEPGRWWPGFHAQAGLPVALEARAAAEERQNQNAENIGEPHGHSLPVFKGPELDTDLCLEVRTISLPVAMVFWCLS